MERHHVTFPVRDLDLVGIACAPGVPLQPGDPRYVDLTPLRQGVGTGPLRRRLLSPPATGEYHYSCFCGHRGSGNSTELLSLQQWADGNSFLTVYVDVDVHFGPIDLEVSDLFLLTASAVEEALRRFDHPLPPAKIRRVVEWFDEVVVQGTQGVRSEMAVEAGAQLGGGLPLGLGRLFAKFTAGARAGTEQVTTARQHIRHYPDTLVDLTNDLLREAKTILAQHGRPRGLLLLLDSLDRYEPERIDRLLFRASDLVRRIACHAIFTLPIMLEHEPLSGPIQDHYGLSVVLPMLSLRRRSDTWAETVAASAFNEDAVAALRGALAQRVELGAVFEDPADADLLIKMSGGCIRDLLHLVTVAHSHSEPEAKKLGQDAVRKAIRQMRAMYVRRLTDEDYERLAQIARRQAVPRDPLTSRLLFHRFALEYLDEKEQPWMDIHPLVVETERFRDVYRRATPVARA